MIGIVDATSFLRLRNRVLYVMQSNPGITVGEIAGVLDVSGSKAYNAIMAAVVRLVRSGMAAPERLEQPRTYRATESASYLTEHRRASKRRSKWNPSEASRQRKRERDRIAYQRRKAQGLCGACGSGLPVGWKKVTCAPCYERAEASRRVIQATDIWKAKTRKRRRTREQTVPGVVENRRAAQRARYWRNKLAGICTMCTEPATDDTLLCARHKEINRFHQREYVRRKRGYYQRRAA